jgi:hypothetical protein
VNKCDGRARQIKPAGPFSLRLFLSQLTAFLTISQLFRRYFPHALQQTC